MKIKVTLVKGLSGRTPEQRATVQALGLNKVNSQAIHDQSPAILGMIRKVNHLVTVEEINA